MLSTVFLVDCVILICRFENGRGVFPFVVMDSVVYVGGLCLWYCGCVWYMVGCVSVIFGGLFLLSPFVVTICCHFFCLVGGGKWLVFQMCPQIFFGLQVFCIPIGAAGPRVVRRVCPLRHRQVVQVACRLQRVEDPEGVRAFGAVEWCLAPLRVDLETGEGPLLASSSGGIDPDEGVVYSWSGACSRV